MKEKSINKIFIFLILTLMFLIVTGCKSKPYTPIEDAKLLTEIVYNSSVKENENYKINDIMKDNKFSNNFYYTSLSIHRSYGFSVSLDFVMTPYFPNYVIGDEVDVVIALIKLYDDANDSNPVAQEMIIFSYKAQIYGFLSPIYGRVDEKNTHNEKELEFSSCIFLTKNAVVKYYEHSDYVYNFELNELDDYKFELKGSQFKAFDDELEELNISVLEDSYVELSSSETIDLVNLSYVEEVMVEAIITSIDLEAGKIYISCESKPSLQSVTYVFNIVDSDGVIYQLNDLKIDDRILIYYYQRYENYSPVNIRVDNIIIK